MLSQRRAWGCKNLLFTHFMPVSILSPASVLSVDLSTLSYSVDAPTQNQELLAIYIMHQFQALNDSAFQLQDGVLTEAESTELQTFFQSTSDAAMTWLKDNMPVGVAGESIIGMLPALPAIIANKTVAVVLAQATAKIGLYIFMKWFEAKLSRRAGDSDDIVLKLEEIKTALESANDLSTLKEIVINLEDESGGKIRVYPFAASIEQEG